MGRGREEVGAEPLVVLVARDHELAGQHAGALLVQQQAAELGIVEVVLAIGRGGWRTDGRVRERDARRFVVDERLNDAIALEAERDPVGDRLVDVPVVAGGLADGDERLDGDPVDELAEHRILAGLDATAGGSGCRDGPEEQHGCGSEGRGSGMGAEPLG